ncbi:MAG: glucose-6-phosphate isomerase [Pseudomonadota bacterium]
MSEQQSISKQLRDAMQEHGAASQSAGINTLFASDSSRAARYGFELEGIYFDFSKTHISASLQELYLQLAQEAQFDRWRHALFTGEKINGSEDRSVLHTLLRDPDNQGIATSEQGVLEQAANTRKQFIQQLQTITEELDTRETAVTDIIHIGIGGSSLGTQLVFEALKNFDEKTRIHFIGNIDAHQLVAVLDQCKVASTLVIGVSKTFSTAETLQNIRSVGDWFAAHGVNNYLDNVYAVTANPDNAANFGISTANTVTFPNWVGGRYSVWSSVSLSAALVLGADKFAAFLAGAASVDRHFYQSEPGENLCFIAAMLDHYYRNFLAVGSRAIFAYDYRLRSLVDYLQQLETESNGKDRQRDGSEVDQLTSPVVWGGVGTDVQHSVFQMLHQGTALIPAEFLLVVNPHHDLIEHHNELLANGVAQTAALLAGQDLATVKRRHASESLSEIALKAKVFSGERPSTTILLPELTPHVLGALLAFYEHRTFCNGVFANINSYDQMGVELGKRLAKEVKPLLSQSANASRVESPESLDASTRSLIDRIKKA